MVLSTSPLSTRHEVEDERAAQDFLHEKGWTDGLPVIPPTPERVLACLDQAVLAPDQVIGIEPSDPADSGSETTFQGQKATSVATSPHSRTNPFHAAARPV
jgi:hypothetical protein